MAYPDLSNYQGSVDPAAFRASLNQSHIPVAQPTTPTYTPPAPVYTSPSYTPPRAPVAASVTSTPAPPMPNEYAAIRKQMDANSAAYNQTQDTAEQQRLHDENLKLGAQIGATYNQNGEWTFPSPPPQAASQTVTHPQSAGIGQTGPTSQYIPGVGTVVPGMGVFPSGSSQMNIPTPGMPQGVPAPMTPQQIQEEAQARIDKLLAQKKQVATQQKQALQTEFDRQQALNKDNRVLQDTQFARLNNPFSGGTDYRRAMLDRERGITDRQAQQDLSSRLSNIDSALADFQNLSDEQRQQIIDDLTRQERGYGLQLAQMLQSQANADRNFGLQQGQLIGDYNGQRTLQGQQLDNNQANAEAKQRAEAAQQHIQLAQFLTQQTGKLVYPTNDPMEAYAQVADVPTLAAQKLALDAQQVGFDQAIKKALAENTINKTQADIMLQAQQQAETAGYHQQSLGIQQQAQQLSKDRLDFEKQQAASKNTDQSFKKIQDEAEGLVTALRGGKMTPAKALQQIDEDTQLGFYTPIEATYLKSILQNVTPNLPSSKPQELTKEQQATIPSDTQIEKEWVTAGKPGGLLDYQSWYKNPNGKMAGTSFSDWLTLYGPKMS